MNARVGTGWQTVMTDLSLILFMLTAAALSQAPDAEAGAAVRGEGAASELSQPVAVYAATRDAPPLDEWLAGQSRDPRQQLTIVAHYSVGGQDAAMAQATAMARAAGAAGMAARIVVEPGPARETSATLAYDSPAMPQLARALHVPAAITPAEGTAQ